MREVSVGNNFYIIGMFCHLILYKSSAFIQNVIKEVLGNLSIFS